MVHLNAQHFNYSKQKLQIFTTIGKINVAQNSLFAVAYSFGTKLSGACVMLSLISYIQPKSAIYSIVHPSPSPRKYKRIILFMFF
jgi:hypothetical protein